jgi:hypothetical protein
MSADLQGSLICWAFVIILMALFAAALFRPERIRQRPRFRAAAILLAVAMFLECVGPFLFPPLLDVPEMDGNTKRTEFPASGGVKRAEALASRMRDHLDALKVISLFQHVILAVALLIGLSAFFDATPASGQQPIRNIGAPPGPQMAEEQQAAPRPRIGEDACACLSCGMRIPPDAAQCPGCGWTWGNGGAASG